MSCCGQKRSEQKLGSASAPRTNQSGSQHSEAPGRVRPREARSTNTALLDYLTRNGKLFGAR